jgi:cell division protein FtsL
VSDVNFAQQEFLRLLVTALVGLIGAAIGVVTTHFLTKRRDREQKRREFALKYLIEVWQNLELSSYDDIDIIKKSRALEKAVTEIQLFGSADQIRLADSFAKEMTANNKSNTTILLQALQTSLRRELGLEPAPMKLFFFRLTPKSPDDLKRYNER